MSYYEQEVQEKEGFNWSNIVVIILVVAMSVWGVSALVEGDNKVKAKNQEVNAYNATQREALGKIFSESNKATVDNWISTYVSKENTEVFKKFYQLNRELVTKGVGSKDAFFEVDKSLTNLVFCVQGEKDVENLNHFMENLIFDTPEHKQIVTYLKNKYNYSDKKITMPSEEDILEMCDFKSFDKDLKTANQTLNEQITDPSKKVIIEDVE